MSFNQYNAWNKAHSLIIVHILSIFAKSIDKNVLQ